MADKGKFSMPAFLSAGEKTAIRKKKYTEPGTLRYSLFKATEVNCYSSYIVRKSYKYDIVSHFNLRCLKFLYSEKATKFCEISTLLLSTVHAGKSKVEILQNFVTFSEYMNFVN